MKMIIDGSVEFNVISCSENMNFRIEEEVGRLANVELSFNISYYANVEDLISQFKDLSFASIVLMDGDKERAYNNFKFANITQSIEDFHRIVTNLQFSKTQEV